jgi:hypothetical protein
MQITGHQPTAAATDLATAIREPAYNHLHVPRNEEAALLKYARKHGLGAPLSPEFQVTYLGVTYICQPFALGIAAAPKGQWDKVDYLPW